ncbi:MAG: sulfotransferase family protein [Arenicella sp.]
MRKVDDAVYYCLTLRVNTRNIRPDWLFLRRLQVRPPPKIPGLQARFWRACHRAMVGQYLFDSDANLQRYRKNIENDQDLELIDIVSLGELEECVFTISQEHENVFERPVFVLSAPRAGSTLLYELLEKARGVASLDAEMQAVIDGIPSLNIENLSYASQSLNETHADQSTATLLRSCLIAQLMAPEGRLLGQFGVMPELIRFLEKTPENSLRMAFLQAVFPDALFIYLQRDLRQNVSSLIQAWQHPGFVAFEDLPGWSRGSWSFLLPDRWQTCEQKSLCYIAAFQWSAANQAIIQGLETLPDKQWTSITYTDLIANPKYEVLRLCEFIGVEAGERLIETLSKPLELSSTTLTPPSPVKWKSNPDFEPELIRSLQPLAGRMRNLGVDSEQAAFRSQQSSAVRYSCFVDDLKPKKANDGDIMVAPSVNAQMGNSVPLALLRQVKHRERFLSDHPVLWWQDQATNIWVPLWLQLKQAWLCSYLKPGCPPPEALTGLLYEKLYAAGVLTTAEALKHRKQHGEQLVQQGHEMLQELLYCKLSDCLPSVLCQALSRYYNQMISSGDWPLGDAQVELRHGWHNESLSRFIHKQLTSFVSNIAGRQLKPTYSYTSAYRGGARLDAHMDREQCDYTLSLMIDEELPQPEARWPLWFDTSEGQKSLLLSCGDAVFFRGCDLPHWRDQASRQHRQINLLFHFVPAEWAGVMD